MIIELYNALVEAKISEASAQKATEAVESIIIDRIGNIRQNLLMSEITNLEKDNIGIRSEIRFLAERMDFGFAESEKRMQMINEQMRFGFAETDKRIQMVIDQMKFGFAETDKKLQLLNESMNKRFAYMEKLQISMLGCLIGLLIKFLFFH